MLTWCLRCDYNVDMENNNTTRGNRTMKKQMSYTEKLLAKANVEQKRSISKEAILKALEILRVDGYSFDKRVGLTKKAGSHGIHGLVIDVLIISDKIIPGELVAEGKTPAKAMNSLIQKERGKDILNAIESF